MGQQFGQPIMFPHPQCVHHRHLGQFVRPSIACLIARATAILARV